MGRQRLPGLGSLLENWKCEGRRSMQYTPISYTWRSKWGYGVFFVSYYGIQQEASTD